jgi:hypothetical protein
MSFTRNNRIICDECYLFCSYEGLDYHASFGGTGPEGLDEPEMEHVCAKCWPKYKQGWLDHLTKSVSGDWAKSRAEEEAAKELGLEWVHSGGYVDSRDEKEVHYRYIKTSEKEHYVPYLEWFRLHPRYASRSITESPKVRSATSTDVQKLIKQEVDKARIDELRRLAIDFEDVGIGESEEAFSQLEDRIVALTKQEVKQ